SREVEIHSEAARVKITCRYRSAVDCNGAGCDREPETVAADRPVARGVHAIERLENQLQILLGHTRTAVANHYFDALYIRAPCFDAHSRSSRTVPDGIADDVLQRTAQQLTIAVDSQRSICFQCNCAAARICFDANVGHNVGEQISY